MLGKSLLSKNGQHLEEFLVYSMVLKWKDERYVEENRARETECDSNQVTWTQKNQFWIPYFYVKSALGLVW